MTFEGLHASPAFQVPKAYVKRTREHALLILAPRQALHMGSVSADHPKTTARLDIPDAHGSVPRTRNGAPPIGSQQRTVSPLGVSREHLQTFARLEVPYTHAAIAAIAASGDG